MIKIFKMMFIDQTFGYEVIDLPKKNEFNIGYFSTNVVIKVQ